jgi:tetratricopeptide (TPR) repeat protein
MDCVVCKNKIGWFRKKIKITETDYCHEDCWIHSNQGKAYNLLVEARLDLNYSNNSNRYKKALEKVNKALKYNFFVIDLLSLKSNLLGSQGNYKEAVNVGLEALDLFNYKYGDNFIVNQINSVRLNKLSQDFLIQNENLIDLYGDTLAFISISYVNFKKYREAIPYIKEELEIYANYEPAKKRLKMCKDKLSKKK